MENQLTQVMSKNSIKKLIDVCRKRDDYQKEAIEAAEFELQKRGFTKEQIETLSLDSNNDFEHQLLSFPDSQLLEIYQNQNSDYTKEDLNVVFEELKKRKIEPVMVDSEKEKKPSEIKRKLTFYWAPVIVTSIGAFLVLISMFLPHLSSYEVAWIENNLMIQNEPVYLLCTIGAIISIFRYYSVGSNSSAHISIWVGIWFLGWSIYDSYGGQLVNSNTGIQIETSAAAGLWAAGVGSAFVALGGLMMRFPHSRLLVGQTISLDEKNKIDSSSKICPKCAETIKSAAVVCRYCGHKFDNVES